MMGNILTEKIEKALGLTELEERDEGMIGNILTITIDRVGGER